MRTDVSCKEDGVLLATKVVIDCHSLWLLLLAVQAHDRHTRPELLERLINKPHLLARRQEHDALAGQVRPDERKEHVELVVELGNDVALDELGRRGVAGLLVDGDVLWLLEAEPREILDRLCLRGGKEKRLALAGEVVEDGVEGGGETEIEDAIGLVEDEQLHVAQLKVGRLIHVLEKAAGRANENVHAGNAKGLALEILAADDEAGGELMVDAGLAENLKDLEGELARGGDDDGAEAVHRVPLFGVEALKDRDDKGERLAGTGLGGAEDIAAGQRKGESASLDVGQLNPARLFQTYGACALETQRKMERKVPLSVS